MTIMDEVDLLSAARKLAQVAHVDQRYGDHPYTYHLSDVANVLFEFSVWNGERLAAAWLHDALEDTELTREQIAEACGERVAEIVWRVTDEPGANRAARKAATLPKIAADMDAILIKLADRIANVRQCLRDNSALLKMYRKEYQEFSDALRAWSPVAAEPMWKYLDSVLMEREQ